MNYVIDKDPVKDILESIEEIKRQQIMSIEEIARKHAFPFRVIRVSQFRDDWAGPNAESVVTGIRREFNLGVFVTNNTAPNNKGGTCFQNASIKAYKVLKTR